MQFLINFIYDWDNCEYVHINLPCSANQEYY